MRQVDWGAERLAAIGGELKGERLGVGFSVVVAPENQFLKQELAIKIEGENRRAVGCEVIEARADGSRFPRRAEVIEVVEKSADRGSRFLSNASGSTR
jgi:hypothetical protein